MPYTKWELRIGLKTTENSKKLDGGEFCLIKEKIFEIVAFVVMAIGIMIGSSDHGDAQDLYYGGNHGGDIHQPPEGSVIDVSLSEKWGMPVAVDTEENTYYAYVVSHWFDPQQMAEFPAHVWGGIGPYDHSMESGGNTGNTVGAAVE